MSGLVYLRAGALGLFAGALAALPGFGQSLPAPAGPTILTVTGLDPANHPGGQAAFDLPMLKALPQATIETTSIWTDGRHHYTGVPLSALAGYLHLTDVTLRLHALNDYSVEMPLSETETSAPVLAYQMDGAPMSVRDKGPIWIVYPYDSGAQYRSDTIYSRSVWQLDRIDVLR